MIAMNMPSRIESGQFVEVAIIVHRKKKPYAKSNGI